MHEIHLAGKISRSEIFDISYQLNFSPPNAEVLYHCRPSYWFAAHMHVKWVALVDHDKLESNEDDEQEAENVNKNRFTRFLGML